MTDNVYLVERFKEKMREKNISCRGLARDIVKQFGEGGPCYTTISRILLGRYSNDGYIGRMAQVLGIIDEDLEKKRTEEIAPPVPPRRKLLDERFKEVERSIQSSIRNLDAVKVQLQHGKNQLREAEKNVSSILSFLSTKFKQLQELKSSIQSME